MNKQTLLLGLCLILSSTAFAQESRKPLLRNVGDKIENVFNGIFKKKDKAEKPARKKVEVQIQKPVQKPVVQSTPKTPVIDLEQTDDLTINMSPRKYRKRSEPIFNIGLIYYGEHYTEEDFMHLQELLEKRFEMATDNQIKLNVVFRAMMPFKQKISDFPEYTQKEVTDIERLQRLWYYDNMNMKVVSEVYNEAKSHNLYGKDLSNIDALAVVTGAQFDGLGFAAGRIAITENPMEIAWGLEGGGWVEVQSDAKVVDELIHELGHTLHIGHAADQCFGQGKTIAEINACCDLSENKNDVQSYCRKRNEVNEEFFFKFEACNQKNIREKIVPAMLKGEAWAQELDKCE